MVAKRDSATAAAKNKRIRQESLRELLAEQCRVQHIIENIKKMENEGGRMEAQELQALKYATDTRVKVMGKYLPDLKAIEIEGNVSNDSHEEWLKHLSE